MEKFMFKVTLGTEAENHADGSKQDNRNIIQSIQNVSNKKLPIVSDHRISLIERSRAKGGIKHLIAGASKFHGPASIYRNDRPHEIRGLVGVQWECIISGEDHILAQDKQGALRSWGRGEGGQLGHGKFCHSGTPTAIETFQDCVLSHISCGAQFSAALTEDGQLFTWGLNSHGQLGHGNVLKVSVPTPVAAMFRLSSRHVAMMACGYTHMIVLTTARDVFTWGNNEFGQLGLGVAEVVCPTPQRVRIMSGLEIKQFGAGENHTCVLTSTGDIYTWGRGDYGQLGHGDQLHKDAPTLLKAFDQRSQPRKMSVGADFIFVLTYSGAVYSWGRNTFGQLGHGVPVLHDSKHSKQPADEPNPRLVSFFSGSNDEIEEGDISLCSIACGTHHVMALSSNRTMLYAWGRGEHGQLGLDLRDSRTKSLPLPTVVPRLKGYTILQIACGLNHTIITADTESKQPTILSWGRGSYGQLGHGSGKPVAPPYFKSINALRPQSALDSFDASRNEGSTRSATAELRRSLSSMGERSLSSTASGVRKIASSSISNDDAERITPVRRLLDPVFSELETYNAADDENSDFATAVLKQYMSRPPYRKHDLDPDPISTEALLALAKPDAEAHQRARPAKDVQHRLPPRPSSTLGFQYEAKNLELGLHGDVRREVAHTRGDSAGASKSNKAVSEHRAAVNFIPQVKTSSILNQRIAEPTPYLPRRPNTALR